MQLAASKLLRPQKKCTRDFLMDLVQEMSDFSMLESVVKAETAEQAIDAAA